MEFHGHFQKAAKTGKNGGISDVGPGSTPNRTASWFFHPLRREFGCKKI